MKNILLVLCGGLISTSPLVAQKASGFMFPSRFGLSYQEKLGVDVGVLSFNRFNDRALITFYDVSIGAESYVAKPFVLAPKVSFDFGIGDWIMVGGGLDVSHPTDFSKSTWLVTPKAGLSLASVIRLYYGHNIFRNKEYFPHIGKHKVSLELNLAAFHDFKMGL